VLEPLRDPTAFGPSRLNARHVQIAEGDDNTPIASSKQLRRIDSAEQLAAHEHRASITSIVSADAKLSLAQEALLVLELFIEGHHEISEMSRSDFYNYIKRAVNTVSPHQSAATEQFARLTARDIRKLDDSFHTAAEPMILARQNVILINIEPLRAVVLRDRCLMLLPYGMTFANDSSVFVFVKILLSRMPVRTTWSDHELITSLSIYRCG
jgi:hypothetical protein